MNFEKFESMYDLNLAAQRLTSHGDDCYADAVDDAIKYITAIETNEIQYEIWRLPDAFGCPGFDLCWDAVSIDEYDEETNPDKKRRIRVLP